MKRAAVGIAAMYKPVKTGIVEAPHTNTIHKQSTTQARPCERRKKKNSGDFVVCVFFFFGERKVVCWNCRCLVGKT